VLSLACPDGGLPFVGARHAPAIRLERAIHDLYGLVPSGRRTQAWLDHGRWGCSGRWPPRRRRCSRRPRCAYRFLPAEGPGLHQIPVGPVHAGIIEPGHFRFTASGETVVRLEERLGYVHKGIDGLTTVPISPRRRGSRAAPRAIRRSPMRSPSPAPSRRRPAASAPPRAVWLRALMAEIERVANHLGDIGAICNDAAFALMHAHTGVLRERVLRFAEAAFGHRLMMDRVIPGGVAADLSPTAARRSRRCSRDPHDARRPRRPLRLDRRRCRTARSAPAGSTAALARASRPGGYRRARLGPAFDARRDLPYAPYEALDFDVPVLGEGDVNARVWIRIREVEQSLVADRPDRRAVCRRVACRPRSPGGAAKAWRWSSRSAATGSRLGPASAATERVRALPPPRRRRGSSGRCSRP
jgi:hypothetical protein